MALFYEDRDKCKTLHLKLETKFGNSNWYNCTSLCCKGIKIELQYKETVWLFQTTFLWFNTTNILCTLNLTFKSISLLNKTVVQNFNIEQKNFKSTSIRESFSITFWNLTLNCKIFRVWKCKLFKHWFSNWSLLFKLTWQKQIFFYISVVCVPCKTN